MKSETKLKACDCPQQTREKFGLALGNGDGRFWIICLDCGVRGAQMVTQDEAEVAWNQGKTDED